MVNKNRFASLEISVDNFSYPQTQIKNISLDSFEKSLFHMVFNLLFTETDK
jgi:hypothetical protein